MEDWQTVPVLASNEPLALAHGLRLVSAPAYRARGYRESLPDVWVRAELVERLNRAAGLLPAGLTIIALDGWRPVELQAQLHRQYRDLIADETGLTGAELEAETCKYVKQPSTDPQKPSPHLTGGSFDGTLGDAEGRPLDMGGEYDELGPRSATNFYERDDITDLEREFRDRRRLLCAVMTHAGFSNYPEEWWHFDCGNQMHHARVGGPARYGPVLRLPRDPYKSERRGESIAGVVLSGLRRADGRAF